MDYFVSSLGSATIVMELIDSESRAVIARAVDSRSVDQRSGLMWSNTASNSAEVRQNMRQWASLIRRALERTVAVDDSGNVLRENR